VVWNHHDLALMSRKGRHQTSLAHANLGIIRLPC
jgi:hypothetical protein